MQAQSENIDGATISRRTAFLGIGVFAGYGILTSRLYYLQVTKAEDYRALSENNRFNFNITLPSRGRILDRNGIYLAVNRQDYRLILVPEQVKDIDLTLQQISKVLPLQEKTIRRIKTDVKENASFVPILIENHLDWKTFAALNLQTPDLPGLIPEVGEGRAYPFKGLFAHSLGYVGRANKEDVASDRDPLLRQPTFRIGKLGVEAAKDKDLRGKAGKLKVEVNAVGRIVREWPDANDVAENGKDIWLTLDSELQKYAAELFEEDSGGLAVIDTVTGELRALLSMPTYDGCLLYTSPSPRDQRGSRMPSSA